MPRREGEGQRTLFQDPPLSRRRRADDPISQPPLGRQPAEGSSASLGESSSPSLPRAEGDLAEDHSLVTSDVDSSFQQLEAYARQLYIATFSNHNIEQPVQTAFPGMSANHEVYRKAVQRVRSLYKSYKSRTLQDAEKWFCRWLSGKGNGEYASETKFKVLKEVLNRTFDFEWIPLVFTWARTSIDFEACTPLGRNFLKCRF
jgi:hypothetical protein